MELIEMEVLLLIIWSIVNTMVSIIAFGKTLILSKQVKTVSPEAIIEKILSTRIPVSVNTPNGMPQFTPPMQGGSNNGKPMHNPLTG